MSDVSQGPGWWRASDGKWYPPADASQPGPGWWLASDGNWYPPEQRTTPADASDPSVRTPVKPVAKPVSSPTTARSAPGSGATVGRPSNAAMGTPAGPAVAPGTASAPQQLASPTTAGPAAHGRNGSTTPPSTGPAAKQATAAPKGPKAKPAAPAAGADPDPTSAPEPTIAAALSPDAQIRARNEQSRRDAAVLFGARKTAATRALGNISALLEDAAADITATEARPPGPSTAAPARDAAPAPKTRGKLGRVGRSAEPIVDPATPSSTAPANGAPSVPPPSTDPPLLEVKQGTLAADIEHIGERLVIFNDRVELHDRNDRVRQVIAGGDIADVVVHKKFTGSTVTVEAGTGESIVAKGLKPEQADEIRSVILKRTRAGSPSAPPADTARPGATTGPGAGRAASDESVVDARDPKPPGPAERAALLAKLADLHRAGVLTDAELADKQALVENLVRGETLAVAGPSA